MILAMFLSIIISFLDIILFLVDVKVCAVHGVKVMCCPKGFCSIKPSDVVVDLLF